MKAKVVGIPSKRLVNTRRGASVLVSNVRARVDDTGSIRLNLWSHQIDTVRVGDEPDIQGGHVGRHTGNLQLRLGKRHIFNK